MPQNLLGREAWQMAFDFDVQDGGITVQGGSVIVKDLVYYGGGIQWSTPIAGDGLAFGISTRMEIGSLALQPNGRATAEALVLSACASAPPPRMARRRRALAHGRRQQPGRHLQRPHRRSRQCAPAHRHQLAGGRRQRGRRHAAGREYRLPQRRAGNVDLGSSRIGSIQLQYLDIKFRP
jgi:hypothetical protein